MQKKKKPAWQKALFLAFCLLLSAGCGYLLGYFLGEFIFDQYDLGESLLISALLLIGLYAVIFLHTILHEAGHLLFGHLTGYRFSSFRIGSFMWLNENGKLKFKRLHIAGTSGQCLMAPPDLVDGKIPVALYNFGGSIVNAAVALLCLILFFLLPGPTLLRIFLLIMAVVGLFDALLNGLPMQLGTINNDGHNALSLGKNKAALFAFWVQLKANEQLAKGVRLREMPQEWFTAPSVDEMQNSMVATMGVFACNRLMDEERFEEAAALTKQYLDADTAIVGLHRGLLTCDLIFCELIGENRAGELEAMLDAQQKKLMKSMKNFPSVLRTQYAYALLAERDLKKAAKLETQFEAHARTYPYPREIDGERHLLKLAKEKAESNIPA